MSEVTPGEQSPGITLPANIVWLDDGRLGVAIVQGDMNITPDAVGAAFAAVLNKGDGAGVPHLFVAPQVWAQYDKPCERLAYHKYTEGHCSDCQDGRQVWTVRWFQDDGPGPYGGVHRHEDRATIQVVPVVEDDSGRAPKSVVIVNGAEACLILDAVVAAYLPLDPLPTPGRDYAVIVTITS